MTGVKVVVSANWDRWTEGFGRIDPDLREAGRVAWQAVTDVMFERSQQFAHVLTGENKASGHAETVIEGGDLIGRIEYDSDHAIYEEARGGEHAYLTRAYQATEAEFVGALGAAWERVVASWR